MTDGHDCVVTDNNPDAVAELEAEGATGAEDLADLVAKTSGPRHIWIMVPVAIVDRIIDELVPLLSPGDIIIDGGNSFYRHDIDRADRLAEHDLHYVDVGTSGGVYGLERGFCLMVGGETEVVETMAPLFDTISPPIDSVPRTANRSGDIVAAEHGWLHCGPAGAGHFVKMVHNGIEYGMMAASPKGSASSKLRTPAPRNARPMPRRPHSTTPGPTSTTSTSKRSPSCGGAAASSTAG